MARYGGKNLFVSFGGTELTGDFRGGDEERNVNLIDSSAGDDAGMTYLVDKKDGTFALQILDNTTSHTAFDACEEGTEGELIWGPEGNGAGKPKHSVNAIVKSRKRKHPYRDVVIVDVEFQFSAAAGVTDSTFSA